MTFTVITNPSSATHAGFTPVQFKKLDDLYCRAASLKTLNYRTVECDFEAGIVSYTYYVTEGHEPYLRFLISRAGPKDMLYEVYMQGKGRIARTSLYDRAFEHLRKEVSSLSH